MFWYTSQSKVYPTSTRSVVVGWLWNACIFIHLTLQSPLIHFPNNCKSQYLHVNKICWRKTFLSALIFLQHKIMTVTGFHHFFAHKFLHTEGSNHQIYLKNNFNFIILSEAIDTINFDFKYYFFSSVSLYFVFLLASSMSIVCQ